MVRCVSGELSCLLVAGPMSSAGVELVPRGSSEAVRGSTSSVADWQARGHDAGSTVSTELPNAALLAQARGFLGLPPQ